MCGIVGISATKLTKLGLAIFDDLMVVSNLRGRWGAGIAAATRKDIKVFKTEYSGIDVIDMKAYDTFVNNNDICCLLGHTRHPTKGGDTIEFAHPHVTDNYIGVHNGTLTSVDGDYIVGNESDSKKFYEHANKVGLEEAVEASRGAYCFVSFDNNKSEVKFIRNNERTLFFAKINWGKENQALVWASEAAFLHLVLTRKGITNYELVALPTNEMWSIGVPFGKNTDFRVRSGIYGGSKFWRATASNVVPAKKEANPVWANGFQSQGKSSTVDSKATYVYRDGAFVDKRTLTDSEPTQVCLRRPYQTNELEGAEKVQVPNGKAEDKGVANEQRPKASGQVSLGGNGTAFLRSLDKLMDKNFQKANDDGPNYEDRTTIEDEIEEEFNRMLAQKTERGGESQLWDDLQEEAEELVNTAPGCYISREYYDEIIKQGCAWYGDSPCEGEDIVWINRDTYVLAAALEDTEAMEELSLHFPYSSVIQGWLKGSGTDVRTVTMPVPVDVIIN